MFFRDGIKHRKFSVEVPSAYGDRVEQFMQAHDISYREWFKVRFRPTGGEHNGHDIFKGCVGNDESIALLHAFLYEMVGDRYKITRG